MSTPEFSEHELLALIQSACDATLTPNDFNRLVSMMRGNVTARKIYLAYMLLDAELHWHQSGGASAAPLSMEPPGGMARLNPLALPLAHDDALIPPLPVDLSGMDPVLFERLAERVPTQVVRPQRVVGSRLAPAPHRSNTGRWIDEVAYRLVGTFVFWIVLIIAVSPYLLSHFGKMTVKVPVAPPGEPQVTSSGETFAMLMSAVDCRWQGREKPFEETDSIGSEKLDLVSGTAELEFRDGARLVLEGPACLVLQGSGRALLEHGKLAAQVPKRAIGFTVATPTAEIVDFGTEFGVAVSKAGRVEAAVLVGKIEVGAPALANDRKVAIDKQKRVVHAGQAITARLDTNRLAIDTANFNDMMKTSLAKPFESLARMSSRTVAYGVPDRTAGDLRDFHGGLGLDFEVTSPVRVFSLGVFDHLGDGLDPSTRPIVQLWSRDTKGTPKDTSDDAGREMLASQAFMAGDSSELRLGHRLKALPKPIELPIGSYSIVAYGLANGNPFIGTLPDTLQLGSVTASEDAGVKGRTGGAFARNDNESFFGDTHLSQSYTLGSTITAAGSFAFSKVDNMHECKCFVGHFSKSTADNLREFMGVEFVRGDVVGLLGVRARIYRHNGDGSSDAYSDYINLNPQNDPYQFDYVYDPNYEADSDHAGPEGRLSLHIYNESRSVDETIFAINAGTHRDADSTFDAFGMGIGTLQSMKGDDPKMTGNLFIDDVTYSGHDGTLNFDTDPGWSGVGNTSDGNSYGWIQPNKDVSTKSKVPGENKTSQMSIIAIGSRFGECNPGAFPTTLYDKKIGYAAGTFEYVPQRQQNTEAIKQ